MTIPRMIDTGIFRKLTTDTPFPCIIPVNVVNSTITYTSSTDAPARINCGIPSSVPYPSSINFTIRGTTTAGETAARTEPKIADSNSESPSKRGARTIIPKSSKLAGTKHIITAGRPIFLSPEISSPNPARIRMMISAILRSSDEIFRIFSSNRFNTYGPRTIPVSNIPRSPGNFNFLQIQLILIPQSRISAILNNIKIPSYSSFLNQDSKSLRINFSIKFRFGSECSNSLE